MRTETKYEFRKRLNTVHKPDRRVAEIAALDSEIVIDNDWRIAVSGKAEPLIKNVAEDLQDYLLNSMGVSVPVIITELPVSSEKIILLADKQELPELGRELNTPRSYRLQISETRVTVCGNDSRGTAQGSYFLEDLMNLRRAPYLKKENVVRKPRFSPRMTHSGWGIDQFPDPHLNALAHAGIDSILIFAKGVNHSTMGLLDFNDMINRAASYGLDVYFYSYLHCEKHPDAPEAIGVYENTYGRLFKECPKAKGIILVGESCEFSSKDPDVLPRTGREACYRDGIREVKPRPGWWPCVDFPQWLNLVKKCVRRHAPEAEIVFWTYNWGWAPEKARLRLLNAIPDDVTLLVTFEMFEPIRRDGIVNPVMDYTITFPGPGRYFVSEAQVAKKRGIKLYAMGNTGGCTWDFGTTPYEPVPYQWLRRYRGLFKAREQFGLSGLMEEHHFGFYPSFINEFAKWMFWEPGSDPDTVLRNLAVRDFGESGADAALACWQNWSDAINDLIPTNEDQYGPLRAGPAYPFIFHPDITRTFNSQRIIMPAEPLAHFGSRLVQTFYHPFENEGQSPGTMRYPVEIKHLEKMIKSWNKGIEQLHSAISLTPPDMRTEADRMLALGEFIRNSVNTVINIKKWWQLNVKLMGEESRDVQNMLLDQLVELAESEIANAEATIPVVERDSRLGWEPSMEYICDRWHLEWKIRQMRKVIQEEIPAYRKSVNVE